MNISVVATIAASENGSMEVCSVCGFEASAHIECTVKSRNSVAWSEPMGCSTQDLG